MEITTSNLIVIIWSKVGQLKKISTVQTLHSVIYRIATH